VQLNKMTKLRRINLTDIKFIPLVLILLPLAFIFNVILVVFLLLNPRSWKFDKKEAQEILDREVQRFRKMNYQECLQMVEKDSAYNELISSDRGTQYQIDVQLIWDKCINGPIRVIASIDDGRLRAYRPLSVSFVVDPMDELDEGI